MIATANSEFAVITHVLTNSTEAIENDDSKDIHCQKHDERALHSKT
ncbi:MAG: hypothetical protein AAF703_04720 [Cyanobacteria bacterium P01_D01_bin.105]